MNQIKNAFMNTLRSFGCVFHELVTTEKLFKDSENIQNDIKNFVLVNYAEKLTEWTPLYLRIFER